MLLEGKIEGKKGRGKPRVTWTKKKKKKNIKEWLGHTYNGCVVVNFFYLGNFYFCFVSTSLAHITIPKNKRKTKIT